jgi:glucokinase
MQAIRAAGGSVTNRQASAWGGLDLGGTKIEAVVVNAHGEVLGRGRAPTPQVGGPEAIVQALADALGEAARAAEVEVTLLGGVGVGAPGAINVKTGVLEKAPNLPGWDSSYPLTAHLLELVQSPVRIGNDVDVAVEAEARLGAGRGFHSVLGVWWGTGVGGGLMFGGHLWSGRGAAGEVGHTVVREGGARCRCGRRGCLEAYVGRACLERKARKAVEKGADTVLFELMQAKKRTRLSSSVWAKALKQEDRLAEKLIHRAIRYLGAGIASVVNLLDLEAVVIGGGMGSRLGPTYLHDIEAAMWEHLFLPERPPVLQIASLGELSGAVGAALLVVPTRWDEEWREKTPDLTAIEGAPA